MGSFGMPEMVNMERFRDIYYMIKTYGIDAYQDIWYKTQKEYSNIPGNCVKSKDYTRIQFKWKPIEGAMREEK